MVKEGMNREDAQNESFVELQEELQEIKEAAAETMADSNCKLHKLKDELHGKTRELIDEITPILEKYRDSGKEVVYKVEDKIIEKPLPALMIAFAAGLVIGKLLDSRKH